MATGHNQKIQNDIVVVVEGTYPAGSFNILFDALRHAFGIEGKAARLTSSGFVLEHGDLILFESPGFKQTTTGTRYGFEAILGCPSSLVREADEWIAYAREACPTFSSRGLVANKHRPREETSACQS